MYENQIQSSDNTRDEQPIQLTPQQNIKSRKISWTSHTILWIGIIILSLVAGVVLSFSSLIFTSIDQECMKNTMHRYNEAWRTNPLFDPFPAEYVCTEAGIPLRFNTAKESADKYFVINSIFWSLIIFICFIASYIKGKRGSIINEAKPQP